MSRFALPRLTLPQLNSDSTYIDFSIIRQRLRAALDTRFSAFVRCRMQFSARGVRQAGVLGLILFSISISVWKEISAHGWKYNYNPRNTRLIYSRQYMGASSVHPGHTDWMEGVIRCRRFFIKTILTGASRGARQSDNITDLRAAASTTSATTTVVTTTSTSTQPTQPSTSTQPTQPSYCYMFYILWATQMILPIGPYYNFNCKQQQQHQREDQWHKSRSDGACRQQQG